MPEFPVLVYLDQYLEYTQIYFCVEPREVPCDQIMAIVTTAGNMHHLVEILPSAPHADVARDVSPHNLGLIRLARRKKHLVNQEVEVYTP